MQRHSRSIDFRHLRPLLAGALALLGACGDASGPVEPEVSLLRASGTLLECPTNESSSASGLVTPLLGGTVAVGGTAIVVPAGGVLEPVPISVTVPASRFVEAEIRAGSAEHFLFSKTVIVSLDYSRCDREDIQRLPLTAWHIDPVTKELFAPMGGVDDKLAKRVSFLTDHLSGYAIAF